MEYFWGLESFVSILCRWINLHCMYGLDVDKFSENYSLSHQWNRENWIALDLNRSIWFNIVKDLLIFSSSFSVISLYCTRWARKLIRNYGWCETINCSLKISCLSPPSFNPFYPNNGRLNNKLLLFFFVVYGLWWKH